MKAELVVRERGGCDGISNDWCSAVGVEGDVLGREEGGKMSVLTRPRGCLAGFHACKHTVIKDQ